MERIAVVIPAYNEEKMIRATLDALLSQTIQPDAIVVVDNNSTDATARIIGEYRDRDAKVHLVSETKKGTGHACNAGFRYAIDSLGATIICRTDADTLPSPMWVEVIGKYFNSHPKKQILTGPNPARTDDGFYRWYDALIWPVYWRAARLFVAVAWRELYPLKTASGHNLCIRAQAFDAVGGFIPGGIDEVDEDIEISAAVSKRFGFSSLGYASRARVYTSMRRIRKVGYIKLVKYYMQPSLETRLRYTGGTIDIR